MSVDVNFAQFSDPARLRSHRYPPADRTPAPGTAEPKAATGSAMQGQFLLKILDRMGCGYVVFDGARQALEWNASARIILGGQYPITEATDQLWRGVRHLLGIAGLELVPQSICWVTVPGEVERPVAIVEPAEGLPEGWTIIAFLNRQSRAHLNPVTLQKVFGLTAAEARLAVEIANGQAPLEIAKTRNVSRTTVRSQLASLFAKTETKRQAELVALLGQVSVLP